MHNYNNLQIWQDAMDVVEMIYQVTAQFPPEEKYGLRSQMNRSAISIPSNIAEGAGRNTDKEFSHFVSIAIGSMYELHTQIILCERISYIDHCLSMQLQTKFLHLTKLYKTNRILSENNAGRMRFWFVIRKAEILFDKFDMTDDASLYVTIL